MFTDVTIHALFWHRTLIVGILPANSCKVSHICIRHSQQSVKCLYSQIIWLHFENMWITPIYGSFEKYPCYYSFKVTFVVWLELPTLEVLKTVSTKLQTMAVLRRIFSLAHNLAFPNELSYKAAPRSLIKLHTLAVLLSLAQPVLCVTALVSSVVNLST